VARIHDLIRQVANQSPDLARDLQREVDVLSERRAFGLNFERHTPEEVELPGRPVRRGDKVHVLPPRGSMPKAENSVMWVVESIDRSADEPIATIVPHASRQGQTDAASQTVPLTELVVVAEFRDPIYPGLVSTGKVERGGDKPYHSVINAENFHALEALLFTHRGRVDAIYIDPPYNTGARDWKYNNDYVESDDQYRHSKWLAFIERRLVLARELLNPHDSVLIVSIDEKEYARLGLLLEQTFPAARIQMITTVINATGVIRATEFARTNEFVYFVSQGSARISPEWTGSEEELLWNLLQRREDTSRRHGPIKRLDQFYPIYVDDKSGRIAHIGKSLPLEASRVDAPAIPGCTAVFPIRPDGTEMVWGVTPGTLKDLHDQGYVRVSASRGKYSIYYLTSGKVRDIAEGRAKVTGRRRDGSVTAVNTTGRPVMPTSSWDRPSHNAQSHGTKLLSRMIPDRRFPFPKSLYAVEDCLRFFVADKPNAVIVDFFSGSGTTAHAVFRLNKQDGGRRTSISVTNNEVGADEGAMLRGRGLRPGDPEWEERGICDYITKPRIRAAIIGRTPGGEPIVGDYKFADEFPMANGFSENVEFFTLTYETPLRVASNRDFNKIAPLLWLRAGSRGRRIEDISRGWDIADVYGVISDLDHSEAFVEAIAAASDVTHAFVITDEDRLFESMANKLPEHVEIVRLYDAYLRNFELEAGRVAR